MIKTGYLIPVDAQDKVATWIDLEAWLRAVSLLPAKHILVVLDAHHSGIALDPIIKWRDNDSWKDEPLSTLQARRIRRIITSALDAQVALDSGPVYGHSLFTGCLIEGLTHGIRRGGNRVTTGSELGLYVQRRVETYPDSRQTPDFGTFTFDDRGEMVIPLVSGRTRPEAKPEPASAEPALTPPPELLAAVIPAPILPPPTPPPNQVASIAPAAELPEPSSTKPVPPPPTPGNRRLKRSTSMLRRRRTCRASVIGAGATITSPRQARHALSYVLGNWRKHQEDRKAPMSAWTIDWFSSAVMFPGWAEYAEYGAEAFLWRGPATYDPLVVYQPKTWLLREGWKKAGSISYREVPSAKP